MDVLTPRDEYHGLNQPLGVITYTNWAHSPLHHVVLTTVVRRRQDEVGSGRAGAGRQGRGRAVDERPGVNTLPYVFMFIRRARLPQVCTPVTALAPAARPGTLALLSRCPYPHVFHNCPYLPQPPPHPQVAKAAETGDRAAMATGMMQVGPGPGRRWGRSRV